METDGKSESLVEPQDKAISPFFLLQARKGSLQMKDFCMIF